MTEMAMGRPIRPVILAGGAGTRLWPLSTMERPKHLLALLGERSLFEQTIARFGEHFAEPIIVANRAQEVELLQLLGDGATLSWCAQRCNWLSRSADLRSDGLFIPTGAVSTPARCIRRCWSAMLSQQHELQGQLLAQRGDGGPLPEPQD